MSAAGAPIDGYGIGSRLDVSADVPYLDCAYKLQEYAGLPRRKRSEGKSTWPGRKQVFRQFDGGLMKGDTVAVEDESAPGTPLLELVMQGGGRVKPSPPLSGIRDCTARNLEQLPADLKRLDAHGDYFVRISDGLHELARQVDMHEARVRTVS